MREAVAVMQPDLILALALAAGMLSATSERNGVEMAVPGELELAGKTPRTSVLCWEGLGGSCSGQTGTEATVEELQFWSSNSKHHLIWWVMEVLKRTAQECKILMSWENDKWNSGKVGAEFHHSNSTPVQDGGQVAKSRGTEEILVSDKWLLCLSAKSPCKGHSQVEQV